MGAQQALEDAVGILGGSFNPVHMGHVKLAQEIQARCAFDPLWIIPNRKPPHKQDFETDPTRRLEMVKLAFSEIPDTKISTFELDRQEPSYALHTVEHIKSLNPGRPVYFVLGTDAFYDLPQWYEFATLIKSCSFLVVTRAGWEAADIDPKESKLASCIEELREEKLVKNAKPFGPFREVYQTSPSTQICIFEASLPEVSSTEIRLRLQLGVSIKGLVPDNVERYLKDSDLYGKEKA